MLFMMKLMICCCCYVEFIVAAHVDDDERLSLAQCLISFYTANRAARLYTVIYRHLSVALESVVESVMCSVCANIVDRIYYIWCVLKLLTREMEYKKNRAAATGLLSCIFILER